MRNYELVHIAGSSSKSIEDAINNAVGQVESKYGKARWFEVVETRGHVQDGKVAFYQVVLKVGCGDDA